MKEIRKKEKKHKNYKVKYYYSDDIIT